MLTDASRVPLGARAWIADGARGALVAADGTLDWYAPDGFATPAAFWRLLDARGGALRVGPVREGGRAARRLPPAEQRYRPSTNVAETTFVAAGGRQVEVTDVLGWPGPNENPTGRLVRLIRARSGPVDVEVEVIPSGPLSSSGWGPARVVAPTADGLVIDGVVVRTGFAFSPEPLDRDHPRWRAVRHLDVGEQLVISVDRLDDERHQPLSVDGAHRLVETTTTAWRSWLAPLSYDGPYPEAVTRSLLVLRGLGSGALPVGAPVAAGTTSLPRRPGGERTADDRWVRWHDAATAAMVFERVGLAEEAEAVQGWMRAAAEGTTSPWPGWLGPAGEPVPEAEELALEGWRGSQPVWWGRDAGRIDLDLYGDVVAAARAGVAWPALAAAVDWVADHWSEPDRGVWETAGPAGLLVASRVQAWVALDRMARMARAANPLDLAAVGWQQAAAEVARWLEGDGLGVDGGLRRDPSPADEADAALLRVAWRGPWPPEHPIVVQTVGRVLTRLSTGALVSRYAESVDDGRPGPDSPDLVASLWAVRALAALGRWEEAHERMESIVALGGSLGVLAEAVDPLSGQLLGNLPCTAAHLALVEAALALAAGPR